MENKRLVGGLEMNLEELKKEFPLGTKVRMLNKSIMGTSLEYSAVYKRSEDGTGYVTGYHNNALVVDNIPNSWTGDFFYPSEVEKVNKYKFTCPSCGGDRIEHLEDGAVLRSDVYISDDGEVDYANMDVEEAFPLRYQCSTCRFVLKAEDDEPIIDEDELREWLKLHNEPQKTYKCGDEVTFVQDLGRDVFEYRCKIYRTGGEEVTAVMLDEPCEYLISTITPVNGIDNITKKELEDAVGLPIKEE